MRITMIGTGYVGLVSGACLSDFGHDVTCVDKLPDKIGLLQKGAMPIYEPGLSDLVTGNVRAGRLRFTTDLQAAVRDAEAVFIAVGTPSRRGDGHADLRHVHEAARELAGAVAGRCAVVVKSTVPVGTGDEVERILRECGVGEEVAVVSNPEFLREGAAIADFKRPDRIVIGTDDPWARDLMSAVYRPLHLNRSPILFVSRRSAELIKYAANAFLATKISFINEIADLCEMVGADVQDVAAGVGSDMRIGPKFLHPGPGFGGSCFPKDTRALLKTARDHQAPLRIVEAVVAVNDCRKSAMARRVIRAMGGNARGRKVALLGLTFKPNTDDMREAPALSLVQGLQDAGARIHAFDPEGMEQARELMPEIDYAEHWQAAVRDAAATVVVTEWDEFRAIDLNLLKELMAVPVLIDLRNIYSPRAAAAAGLAYQGVGRAPLPLNADNVFSLHRPLAPEPVAMTSVVS
jgi:UDPglucose 6-dehydrogenase